VPVETVVVVEPFVVVLGPVVDPPVAGPVDVVVPPALPVVPGAVFGPLPHPTASKTAKKASGRP
jgi:hypothetical protein